MDAILRKFETYELNTATQNTPCHVEHSNEIDICFGKIACMVHMFRHCIVLLTPQVHGIVQHRDGTRHGNSSFRYLLVFRIWSCILFLGMHSSSRSGTCDMTLIHGLNHGWNCTLVKSSRQQCIEAVKHCSWPFFWMQPQMTFICRKDRVPLTGNNWHHRKSFVFQQKCLKRSSTPIDESQDCLCVTSQRLSHLSSSIASNLFVMHLQIFHDKATRPDMHEDIFRNKWQNQRGCCLFCFFCETQRCITDMQHDEFFRFQKRIATSTTLNLPIQRFFVLIET